ncbi:MAG: extracellular solute-binding protein [Chloroflexi bacterium]|nr:extracellular solute-binding protein [Chloroflexota bacterium]
MHNKLFVALVLLMVALTVGLVSAQDDLAGIDPTGVNIVYWHEWDGAQLEGINEVIRLFQESNEYGITVEGVSLGSTGPLLENVSTGIASGELPNLVGAAFVQNAQGWYQDEILVPLDAYYDSETWGFSEEELAPLNQSIIGINRPQLAPFNGQLLAWPIGVSGNVLSVNLDIIEELNAAGTIDFTGTPDSFEQFRAVACGASTLTAPDGTSAVKGYPMRTTASDLYSFIFNQGGTIFDEEAGQYNFTNEGAIAAMQFLQDLYNEGCSYFPEGGNFANTAEFSLGLNPFAIGSSVGVPFIQGDMDEAGYEIEWVNTTPPFTEGNRSVVSFLRSIAVMNSTPEENLATWLFIKFWATSIEAQVAWTEAAQYQPYNNATFDALSEEFLTNNPQFNSFKEILVDPNVRIVGAPEHPRGNEISDVVAELASNITVGGMDVAEAAAQAEERANEIYAEVLEDLEG